MDRIKMNTHIIKKGKDLTQKEIDDVNLAKFHEWSNPKMGAHQIAISTYFHLRNEKGELLSLVQLLDIPEFTFNKEKFLVTGIGGMISNVKGKGYGKQLLHGVIKYLRKNKLTTFGFCDNDVAGFYQKSGFTILPDFTKKFVFYGKNMNKIVNVKETNVMYYEGPDQFFSKILKSNPKEIVLSRTPDW